MSSENVIVVFEKRDHRNLVRHLSRLGYSVILVDSMMKALDRINHHNPAAAIVSGEKEIDPLEFVLNVREIDDSLPVIVIMPGLESDLEQILSDRREVYFVSTTDDDFHVQMEHRLSEATR